VKQQEEALVGDREQRVVRELREVRPDALAGGDVEEAVAADVGVGLVEHDPLPREEAGVQAAARVREALAPRAAHGAEADVVGDAAGEDELGDQAGRTVAAEVRPVPRGARALVPPFRGRGREQGFFYRSLGFYRRVAVWRYTAVYR
jgi:hypothetical protein